MAREDVSTDTFTQNALTAALGEEWGEDVAKVLLRQRDLLEAQAMPVG